MSNHATNTNPHRPFSDTYADATERLAATGFPRGEDGTTIPFASADLGKFVWQLDDDSIWMLTAITPTWVQIAGTGSVSVDNSTIEISGGNLRVKDAGVTDAKLTTSYIKSDGTRAFTGDQSMGSHKLTNVTDPSSAQDAATKNYVDALMSGFDFKASVRAATTANIALSGAQTIDGVSVIAGDRVLVKNQSTGADNGIYVCAAGSWSRASDADSSAKVTAGMFVAVAEGTSNADTFWLLTTNDAITLGSSSLTFTQFGAAASPTGSAGGDLSGTYPNPTVAKVGGVTPGTGVTTFLGTPTSANLRAALTDETGTGGAVFADTPTLVTPILGTPTSGNLSNCTTDGTNEVGYKNIPQNSQSAAYTTVLGDKGKHILHPSSDANARTFTIDSNANVAYPIGTAITFVNMTSQVLSIAITSDTMRLAGTGTTGTRSLAQYGMATALKIGTTEWLISGTGLT